MKTKIWQVQPSISIDCNDLNMAFSQAAMFLQRQEVVAFPTETVYGLGGNAYSDEAIRKIFEAKGRPSDNPLIVHISGEEQWRSLVKEVPDYAYTLMDRFWPGPLTLILPLAEDSKLSKGVTAGLSTVGIRMPDHPTALKLIEYAGFPLAAPSANRSGRPSPTRAEHVVEDLVGKIAGVLDSGPTGIGVESTVVDATGPYPVILRPGAVTAEQLQEVVNNIVSPSTESGSTIDQPKSPGMKYAHYAPEGELYVVYGETDKRISYIRQWAEEAISQGKRVGILTFDEHRDQFPQGQVVSLGSLKDFAAMGRRLYDCLRSFDEMKIELIWAEAISSEGLGVALMNRLLKAAGGKARKL
jgi:L-threonylcarbamoyladenylate synthase